MTRPKVNPADRQRTEHACVNCKKRKQKCDGRTPCPPCSKRNVVCLYDTVPDSENGEDFLEPPPSKVVKTEQDQDFMLPGQLSHFQQQRRTSSLPMMTSDLSTPQQYSDLYSTGGSLVHPALQADKHPPTQMVLLAGAEHNGFDMGYKHPPAQPDPSKLVFSSTGNKHFGQSACLSLYNRLRNKTKSLYSTSFPPHSEIKVPQLPVMNLARPEGLRGHLCDKELVTTLAESYFKFTGGIIRIVHQGKFISQIRDGFDEITDTRLLCLTYMMLSIGMLMATPDILEGEALEKLRAENPQHDSPAQLGELFYGHALSFHRFDTENAEWDIEAVQVFTLISTFMHLTSHEDAAYLYLGKAIRIAQGLGLHRNQDTHVNSHSTRGQVEAEEIVRQDLWRTLFVLDIFLSSTLGRPVCIRVCDCSADIFDSIIISSPLTPPNMYSMPDTENTATFKIHAGTVRSCLLIAQALENLYAENSKLSVEFAHKLLSESQGWISFSECGYSSNHSFASLHTKLFQCYAIIVVTQPFFLDFLCRNFGTTPQEEINPSFRQLSNKCIDTSCHIIATVVLAHNSVHMSRRNPFIVCFLFVSTLLLMGNAISGKYFGFVVPQYQIDCIFSAMGIMQRYSEFSPQAHQFYHILQTFELLLVDLKLFQQVRLPESQMFGSVYTNLPDFEDVLLKTVPFGSGTSQLPEDPAASQSNFMAHNFDLSSVNTPNPPTDTTISPPHIPPPMVPPSMVPPSMVPPSMVPPPMIPSPMDHQYSFEQNPTIAPALYFPSPKHNPVLDETAKKAPDPGWMSSPQDSIEPQFAQSMNNTPHISSGSDEFGSPFVSNDWLTLFGSDPSLNDPNNPFSSGFQFP